MTSQALPRRVLLVCYAFPPVGGAGVQRMTKFVKYLPAFGWLPSVLAPSNASMPMLDSSLGSDIPPGTLIRRARTLEPSYAVKEMVSSAGGMRESQAQTAAGRARSALRRVATGVLQPDPQMLWFPAAVRAGRRLLADVPHQAIIATGPPFSSFLIGSVLRRFSALPLVLDYRDEWGLTNQFQENKGFGPMARQLNKWMERAVVRKASAILVTSDASARAVEAVRDEARGHAPVLCVRNGYDPDDFDTVATPADDRGERRYRVVYTGTLWNHTSIAPLVDAIIRLCRERPDLGRHLEVVLAGRRTLGQEQLLQQLSGLAVHLVTHPYLNHGAVIQLMRSADLLCSLTTDAPGAERFINAKIFEYMASRRPILAIAPPGDLWDVLDEYPAASRFRPSDIAGITACLLGVVTAFLAGRREPLIEWDGRRYDRREQTRALAGVLSDVAGLGDEPDRQVPEVHR